MTGRSLPSRMPTQLGLQVRFRARICAVICVALSTTLLTGLFALAQTAAPEPTPTKPSLPPALAMSETAVLRLLIPDFDKKLSAYQSATRDLDEQENYFHPRVMSALETDLGWPGRHFLLVSVDSTVGLCGGCGSVEFAILELPGGRVLWRRHHDGLGGGEFEKVFFAMPGFAVVKAVEYERSLGGLGLIYEIWLRPTLQRDGTVHCKKLWRDLLDFGNSGGRGGGRFSGCGQMTAVEHAAEYVYERRNFYVYDPDQASNGDIAPTPDAAAVVTPTGTQVCESCPHPEGCGQVEIRLMERWTLSRDGGALTRSAMSAHRVDHGTSEVFPFNLSQREASWEATKLASAVVRLHDAHNEDRAVNSPSGRLVARTRDCQFRASLIVETNGGSPLRSIPLWSGEDFEGHPVAVGWSEDGNRVFAVVDFGLDDRVLLSFSVMGQDDYWEKLLTADHEVWKDGFVLAEPVKRQ
jgi:hypothetical protein